MESLVKLILTLAVSVCLYAVVVLVFKGVTSGQDAVQKRLEVIGRQGPQPDAITDSELSKPLYDRLFKPFFASIRAWVLRLLPARSAENRNNDQLKKRLGQAGFTIGVDEYNAIRVLAAIAAVIICLILGSLGNLTLTGRLFLVFGGLFFVYTVMRYYLAAKITARKQKIEAQLSDMLDLLSVSVEAGMGFEQAIQHITMNMEGPLIDELTVTFREMSMGRTRRDALLLLADRCDVEDVRSFASALTQAGQLGISIKNVLRSQSVAIRQSRKNKVQERAATVSTKILFPMLFFIFPVLFIVLLGPAAIKIMGLL